MNTNKSNSKYTWTIDTEFDWGGRTHHTDGITVGLVRIRHLFRAHNIKALFFVSAELIRDHKWAIQDIVDDGHEIGSHGFFHDYYSARFRYELDKEISMELLSGIYPDIRFYRAPKFRYSTASDPYSTQHNTVGLLKHMWLKQRIPANPTFYLHPFDITRPNSRPPNLFCRFWYSKPDKAWDKLTKMVELYPGGKKLR